MTVSGTCARRVSAREEPIFPCIASRETRPSGRGDHRPRPDSLREACAPMSGDLWRLPPCGSPGSNRPGATLPHAADPCLARCRASGGCPAICRRVRRAGMISKRGPNLVNCCLATVYAVGNGPKEQRGTIGNIEPGNVPENGVCRMQNARQLTCRTATGYGGEEQ